MTPRQQKAADRKAQQARIAAAHVATLAVVQAGKCPLCGAGVHRNTSLTGWWQCDQFGADGWRKDNAKPSCSWQGFTE